MNTLNPFSLFKKPVSSPQSAPTSMVLLNLSYRVNLGNKIAIELAQPDLNPFRRVNRERVVELMQELQLLGG